MFKVNHQKITLQVLGQIPIKMIEKFGKKFFFTPFSIKKREIFGHAGVVELPQRPMGCFGHS
jgi:hypothetical protein